MQKNCNKCGSPLNENESFCSACGTPVEQPGASAPNNASAQPPFNPPVYPQPTSYRSVAGKRGGGMGWIVFLRVIAWVLFGAMILAGLIYAFEIIDEAPEIALLSIAGSVLSAFLLVAGIMISLNNASNLRKIAENTADMVELLKNR